jgi:hypothetical protein
MQIKFESYYDRIESIKYMAGGQLSDLIDAINNGATYVNINTERNPALLHKSFYSFVPLYIFLVVFYSFVSLYIFLVGYG